MTQGYFLGDESLDELQRCIPKVLKAGFMCQEYLYDIFFGFSLYFCCRMDFAIDSNRIATTQWSRRFQNSAQEKRAESNPSWRYSDTHSCIAMEKVCALFGDERY